MINEKITRRNFLDFTGKVIATVMFLGSEAFTGPALAGEININKGGEILSVKETKIPDYFKITAGNDLNLLYQGPVISAHILLSSKIKNRIIVAFLNGNSSVGLWFDPEAVPENSGLILETEGDLEEVITEKGKTCIVFNVKTNKKKLAITDIIVDSVRAARDRSHSDYENYKKNSRVSWRNEFSLNYSPGEVTSSWITPSAEVVQVEDGKTLVTLYRETLDEKFYVYGELLFPDYLNLSWDENNFLYLEGEKDITFKFLATSTFPSLTPFREEELINKPFLEKIKKPETVEPGSGDGELDKALKEYSRYYPGALRDLLFLSYREAFLAGSWRFLTYFGRDTMMTLMLLGKVISPEGYEAGMESILERLSPDGDVAHEDNNWWQAEGERVCEYNRLMAEGKREEAGEVFKKLYDENYDYKMVDDDFMFPLMLLNYLKRDDIKDKTSFLNRKNDSSMLGKTTDNKIAIMKNFNKVLEKSLPYFETYREIIKDACEENFTEKEHEVLVKKLIRIHEGEKVGDWRDSETGMAMGVYPGNVNLYLVPASLKAIYSILRGDYASFDTIENLKLLAEENGLNHIMKMLDTFTDENISSDFNEFIRVWKKAEEFFRVKLSCEDMRKRVKDFIYENPEFSPDDRNVLLSLAVSFQEICTIKEFIEGKTPDILKDGLEFYALSLDEDGKPVEVINSDTGFGFILDESDMEEMEHATRVASLNYPLGLMTGGGLLTANPALSGNRELWQILGFGAYHGTVVWSWQMAMMEKGLLYQSRKLPSRGQFRAVKDMQNLAKRMIEIENKLGEMRNFELWGVKIDSTSGEIRAVPYGEGAEAESNAVQLWSTLALTLVNPFEFP